MRAFALITLIKRKKEEKEEEEEEEVERRKRKKKRKRGKKEISRRRVIGSPMRSAPIVSAAPAGVSSSSRRMRGNPERVRVAIEKWDSR
jgi:hypothetical protein